MKGCPIDKPRYRIRLGQYRATFRIIQEKMVICGVAVGKKGIMTINCARTDYKDM